MHLFSDLGDVCQANVPLGPLTWFKIGGPADYLVAPRSIEQLSTVLHRCRESALPVRVLGMGANVLIPDEGVRGVVVQLTAPVFCAFEFDGGHCRAGGGADLTRIVKESVRMGWAGLEQLAGIPGTVGGGICMNCGGRYGDIASAVETVRLIRGDGTIEKRSAKDMCFGYRRSELGDAFVIGAVFALREEDPARLHERFREIWDYKMSTQPPLGANSVGCIFRNPNGQSAGALIDRAGLKGLRMGSAFVSPKHGNFVIADRDGRANDVRSLIVSIRERVADRFGIQLEPEVDLR